MQAESYSSATRAVVRAYLGVLLLALVAAGIILIRTGLNWGYGDWLINYEGGFVRRGLMGEICLLVGHAAHVNPLYFIALIGISCYVVLFVCIWRLLQASSWRWWVIGILVSPATLAFPVISRTSFRKEILYFALLAALIVWLRRNSANINDKLLSIGLGVAGVLLILSHEPLLVYFPYAAAAIFICVKPWKRAAAILILPAILSALTVGAVLTHIGNAEVVSKICASLGTPTVDTCSAAVQTLSQTKEDALGHVKNFIEKFQYYRQYSICLLLGIIPFVVAFRALWRTGSRRSLVIVLGAICLSLPLSFNLFHYGVDWGRWINMHLISIALLILLIDANRTEGKEPIAATPAAQPHYRLVTVFLLIVYATCWSMPGVKDKPRFGYLSLIGRVIHWNGSLTS